MNRDKRQTKVIPNKPSNQHVSSSNWTYDWSAPFHPPLTRAKEHFYHLRVILWILLTCNDSQFMNSLGSMFADVALSLTTKLQTSPIKMEFEIFTRGMFQWILPFHLAFSSQTSRPHVSCLWLKASQDFPGP